jgi:hypothetical protein
MIRNSDGKIAIKWVLNRPAKTVQIGGTKTYYVFTPRFNVWMDWISPEHVAGLLAAKEKTCNCNNGTYQLAFQYANLIDVNVYMTGDRHGNGVEKTWEEVPNVS